MRKIRVATLALTIVVGFAGLAHADGFISPYLGFNTGGAAQCVTLTNCDDKRLNFGVSLGSSNGVLGFEEDIAYARKFFGDTGAATSNGVLTAMSNLLVIIPAGPVHPYVLFGIGLIQPHFRFESGSFDLQKNALGHDIGGGINLFFSHAVGLRGDIRRFRTFKDFTIPGLSSEKIEFWRASAGLTFRF